MTWRDYLPEIYVWSSVLFLAIAAVCLIIQTRLQWKRYRADRIATLSDMREVWVAYDQFRADKTNEENLHD